MNRHVSIIVLGFLCLAVSGCGNGGSDDGAEGPPTRWLPDVSEPRGLTASIDRAEIEDWFMPESMTSGCALFDADGDGDLDAYFVSGWRDADGVTRSPLGNNSLYLQQPDGTFRLATESGLEDPGYGMGVAIGDIDNDGDLDVFVTNWGDDVLFRNEGDGRFVDCTASAGIDNPRWGASAGFCDFDGDGWLDLFITTYVDYDPDRDVGVDAGRRPEYVGPERLKGVPDQIYRGTGDGRFEDVSDRWGIGRTPGRGLGLAFLDLNGDGHLDVYVANDREPNRAWIWDPDKTGFADRALRLSLGFNERGAPEASMGVAVGDVDGDARLDLLLTHLVTETHTLYRQTEPGSWRDATARRGLGASTRNDTGWGCAFVDLEHDGDADLICVNGRVMRGPVLEGARLSPFWNRYAQPDRVLINEGGRFSVGGPEFGAFGTSVENGRGLAVGDVDRDGDPDFLVSSANGTLRLFLNEVPKQGGWLRVRAVDPRRGGRDVEGAVVTLRAGDRVWIAPCARTGSYLSSSEPVAHFGLGAAERIEEVSVVWPGGPREHFGPAAAGQSLVLKRGQGR